MKILITGSGGQLGRELIRLLGREHDVYGFGSKELDVTNLEQVREVLHGVKPKVIIHSAAYTAVDLAESNIEQAFAVNASGTRNVATVAEEIMAKVCYVSTDYVFDGRSTVPYREYDNTNPSSVYGQSKRAGEILTQTLSSRWFIVRTAWLYGHYGNNFVKMMLKLGQEKHELNVVNDQVGSPTNATDLAGFIAKLIVTDLYGVYHATNQGTCSWFEFAQAIFVAEGITIDLNPCSTQKFPRPAPRPKFSVLDDVAIRANGFVPLPHWQDGLRRFLNSKQD